ncbi:MAG TPA: hypothetical protein VK196_02710 [Magnetospirillum sp.]|nr:hypothetical protein [Magnetospirillum sp.]
MLACLRPVGAAIAQTIRRNHRQATPWLDMIEGPAWRAMALAETAAALAENQAKNATAGKILQPSI